MWFHWVTIIFRFKWLNKPGLILLSPPQLTSPRRLTQRLRPWKLQRQLNRVQRLRRKQRRSGHPSHFTVQRHWRRIEIPSIHASVLLQGTSWTSIRFLNILWLPSLQWRRSRTTILWFSLWTFVLTRKRSRMPWKRCMTSRPRKSTRWSGNL